MLRSMRYLDVAKEKASRDPNNEVMVIRDSRATGDLFLSFFVPKDK